MLFWFRFVLCESVEGFQRWEDFFPGFGRIIIWAADRGGRDCCTGASSHSRQPWGKLLKKFGQATTQLGGFFFSLAGQSGTLGYTTASISGGSGSGLRSKVGS